MRTSKHQEELSALTFGTYLTVAELAELTGRTLAGINKTVALMVTNGIIHRSKSQYGLLINADPNSIELATLRNIQQAVNNIGSSTIENIFIKADNPITERKINRLRQVLSSSISVN